MTNSLDADSKPSLVPAVGMAGLAALRAEIDRIDDALHDLLMQRAEVVTKVAVSGKGRVALWHRVAYVLLGATPNVRERVANRHGAAWRQAIWRLAHHPSLGASLVAGTGADPEVVRMIREQDAPAAQGRLAILQAADDA